MPLTPWSIYPRTTGVSYTLRVSREWRRFCSITAPIMVAPAAYGIFVKFGVWPTIGFITGLALFWFSAYYTAVIAVVLKMSVDEALSRAAAEEVGVISRRTAAEIIVLGERAADEMLTTIRRIAEEDIRRGDR